MAAVALRGAALRGVGFFATDRFGAAFLVATAFLAGLVFNLTFVLIVLRAAAFCGTARLAFGRAVLSAVARRLAAGLGEARLATARDVERLKPLVTALISKLWLQGKCGQSTREVAVAE